MRLYFFLGAVIYILILVTLMVWFLKYHGDNQGGSGPLENLPDSHGRNEADESETKPNHISKELFHSGVESVPQRSEVLPGYSSSPRS